MVLAVLVVVAVWVVCCARLVQRRGERAEVGARTVRRPRLLPEGHRPPPGLSPISPSERYLTAESRRGMRELQLFLADQGKA